MNRSLLVSCAYVVDQLAGDPKWFPHPVRLIGFTIARGEAAIRRPGQSVTFELCSGAALSFAVIAAAYALAHQIVRLAHRRSPLLGNAVELLLGWTTLAAANLRAEAEAVLQALTAGDLLMARQRLSRIVGRDTAGLDEAEIARALIETLAESASDGIVAPLFCMALGGVPLAMAYKAVNTLDSIIGHADVRYSYFGKVAAWLDDGANYIPARLTAAALVMVAGPNAASAWSTWRRDGNRHKSPNAGQPEAAMAGALRVRLGGSNTYAGEAIFSEELGREFRSPQSSDVRRAIGIVSAVTVLGVAAATALLLGAKLLGTRGQLLRSRGSAL